VQVGDEGDVQSSLLACFTDGRLPWRFPLVDVAAWGDPSMPAVDPRIGPYDSSITGEVSTGMLGSGLRLSCAIQGEALARLMDHTIGHLRTGLGASHSVNSPSRSTSRRSGIRTSKT
jgi:hypothetical protein